MNETTEPKPAAATVILRKDKDCKGSVRFSNEQDTASLSSIYVNRICPGINEAKTVRVTIEIVE